MHLLHELNFFISADFEQKSISPLSRFFSDFRPNFVIFLQWPTFWDFIDTRLLNYIPSGIQICFPLLWRIYLGLSPSPPPHQVVNCLEQFLQQIEISRAILSPVSHGEKCGKFQFVLEIAHEAVVLILICL